MANNSFEQQLFKAADKLRKNIDAAEYKHVVLGLIFLKYISESFEELYSKLSSGEGEYEGANPEDVDVTTRLREAGKLMGISFINHIVVTKDAHTIAIQNP